MYNLFSAQFLRDNGKADSDSIMRAKATVAFHNQNFKVKSLIHWRHKELCYLFLQVLLCKKANFVT